MKHEGPGMSEEQFQLKSSFLRFSNGFLVLGILGVIGCVIAALQDTDRFFYAYLTSYSYFLSISLGALFFVLIHHVTRSGWSVTIRRVAEVLSANLAWMGLFIIPLLVPAMGIGDMYHWTHPHVVDHDPILQAKSGYLNIPFFMIRNVLYFLVWIMFSRYLLKNSLKQDKSGDTLLSLKAAKWSTLGLVLFALSLTFFAIDWIMSLDAHWFSTIFGVYYFAHAAVVLFATLIVVFFALHKTGHLEKWVNIEHFHDMGKLLFGFNVFWAYIAFSQYFLIWYANIPEETMFYHHRTHGAWKLISLSLPWLHFGLPFLFLLSRNVKRNIPLLATGAVFLLIMGYVDIYWLIMPNFDYHHAYFGIAEIGSLLAIGGFFVFLFMRRLSKYPLIPVKDPRLSESLSYHNT